MIKEKIETFVERYFDNVYKMGEYNTLVAELLEKVRAAHPDLINEFEDKLEKMLDCIYYDMVEEVIHHLKTPEGVAGMKWDLSATDGVADRFAVPTRVENYNKLVFWYEMNKLHAKHINKPLDFYVELAVDNLNYETPHIIHDIKCRFKEIHENASDE
jgi:hypothetical protein